MGWSFNTVDVGKKAFLANLASKAHWAEGYTPLAQRVVGHHVWTVVQRDETGERFMHLHLIAKERGGGWGYKALDESAGPYHYDCPDTLLCMLTDPPNENAKAWRANVVKFNDDRRRYERQKATLLAPGLLISYGGKHYVLDEQHSEPRKGWWVKCQDDGMVYRMKANQIKAAMSRF
jgi:hypothetical protein